jgi:hypothetical protein
MESFETVSQSKIVLKTLPLRFSLEIFKLPNVACSSSPVHSFYPRKSANLPRFSFPTFILHFKFKKEEKNHSWTRRNTERLFIFAK